MMSLHNRATAWAARLAVCTLLSVVLQGQIAVPTESPVDPALRALGSCRYVAQGGLPMTADIVSDEHVDAVIREALVRIMGVERLDEMILKFDGNTVPWPGSDGGPLGLTWSFVPDGTGQAGSFSMLFSKMDGDFAIFGPQARATWVQAFQNGFDRWQELTGLWFSRVSLAGVDWDDGAGWGSPGADGLRGDIRIWGINLGPPGLAAFTQLPNMVSEGDMTFNTHPNVNWRMPFWNPTWGFSRTITHEIGHAVGLNHVCPNNDTMLMQPLATTTFAVYGPQHDDVRGAHSMYGDRYEPNDTHATPFNIDVPQTGVGTVNLGEILEPLGPYGPYNNGKMSLKDDQDHDWFRFYLWQEPRRIYQLTARPIGGNYQNQAQPVNQPCPPGIGPSTNSQTLAKIRVEVLDWQGQVLASGTQVSPGAPVHLYGIQMPYLLVPYYIHVSSDPSQPFDEPQLYELVLNVAAGIPCEDDGFCATIDPCFGYGYCGASGTCFTWVSEDCNSNFIEDACEPDCDRDGIPDDCETDCNGNGVPDDCDIQDCNGMPWCSDVNDNDVPDGCEPDCNGNDIPDDHDIFLGTSLDGNGDGVPDECATTRLVPSQYANLRDAVLASNDGDTIVVAAGTYTSVTDENKDIVIDKTLTIMSEDGPFDTIIDMGGSGRAFLIAEMNQTNWVKIDGFSFINGNVDDTMLFGGQGGAIAAHRTTLTIWRCIFDRNTATYSGGAVSISGHDYEYVNINTCIVSNNTASVGGGIFISDTVYPNVINCTIVKNNALGGFGAGIAHADYNDGIGLVNSIVWGNRPPDQQIAGSSIVSIHNFVPSDYLAINPGTGCITGAPQFVAPASDDYHLKMSSPCINAGSPLYYPPSALTDIDGEPRFQQGRVEMGADERFGYVIITPTGGG